MAFEKEKMQKQIKESLDEKDEEMKLMRGERDNA